jgi:trans-aconitate methyltransferase
MQSAQFQLHASLEDSHWWFTGRRRIMQDLVREILPASGAPTVIDVGCGTGANLAALDEDYTCVGIDPSDEAIELARRRFPGCRFLCGNAPDDLGEVLEAARLILLMDVLEHVPDDFAFLSGLLAASRPGTRFLVTVPANPSFWSAHDRSNGHYRRYDMDRLQRTWAGLPVTTLLLSHYNARLYPIANAVRSWSQWLGRATGRAGTDVSLPIRPINEGLRAVFAGESRILVDFLRKRRPQGYAAGLSLVALLLRVPGEIVVRGRPNTIAPDPYDPVTGQSHLERRQDPRHGTRGGDRGVAGHYHHPML